MRDSLLWGTDNEIVLKE